MAQNKNADTSYDAFNAAINAGNIGGLYIFHGEERYLLDISISELRRRLCPEGLDSFNYKRFEGKDITVDEIEDAINTMPVFAERTLIEIHDNDLFANAQRKERFIEIFTDVPDYACVVFVFSAIEYKPDGRTKLDKELLKNAQVVEFTSQEQAKLLKWISRHFEAAEKKIAKADAEYLAFITDGLMTTLDSEIEKVSAYAQGETVTRADIDAVVAPSLDAVAYKLADAMLAQKYDAGMSILDELFRMREAPQKIIYSISLKMRQLLAARVCIENGMDKYALMDMCGVRYEFQARILMDAARRATLAGCREAVLFCSDAALALNSEPEPEARLIELVAQLALI